MSKKTWLELCLKFLKEMWELFLNFLSSSGLSLLSLLGTMIFGLLAMNSSHSTDLKIIELHEEMALLNSQAKETMEKLDQVNNVLVKINENKALPDPKNAVSAPLGGNR